MRRVRLSRWRDLHPRPPGLRYEHPHPGDLLHLDIKGLPQYQQVTMRGDGRRRGLRRHPGRKALHVAIDDHSRMAFSQLLPDQKTETTLGFLRDAISFYARHHITVRALLTDNGSSYRSHRFRQACQQRDAQLPAWLDYYNLARPQASLAWANPGQPVDLRFDIRAKSPRGVYHGAVFRSKRKPRSRWKG